MTQPSTFPLLALTLMLWLIWSDSVRPRRPSRFVYVLRAAIFIGASGVLMFRMLESPHAYSVASKVLVAVTSLVGVLGAGIFMRKAMLRAARRT
jgi:hypothetical protein